MNPLSRLHKGWWNYKHRSRLCPTICWLVARSLSDETQHFSHQQAFAFFLFVWYLLIVLFDLVTAELNFNFHLLVGLPFQTLGRYTSRRQNSTYLSAERPSNCLLSFLNAWVVCTLSAERHLSIHGTDSLPWRNGLSHPERRQRPVCLGGFDLASVAGRAEVRVGIDR